MQFSNLVLYVSLRVERGNLVGKDTFVYMRLLHSVRNDIIIV